MAANHANQVTVVFGATGGIGTAVSHKLRQQGGQLLLVARDRGQLESLGRELESPHQLINGPDLEQFEACLKAATDEFGSVTGVVNCLGSLLLKPAHRTSWEEWEATMMANLGSAFATVRAAAGAMRRAGGSVVLVSSAAALTGLPNHEAIAAAKAGVIGLTRSAAATYAGTGLRFNAVAPGLVRTKMTQQLWSNETSLAGSVAMHPLGRLGEPDDIASAICWLLDPANSWISGQVITVDGGLANLRGRSKM